MKKSVVKRIARGEILHLGLLFKYRLEFFMVFSFLIIIICMNHFLSNQVVQRNELKEQVEEYKSRNAFVQSKLIEIRLESELSREVVKDSLMSLENHPHKILIKPLENGK